MAYCSKVCIYTASILAVQCFQTAVLNDSHTCLIEVYVIVLEKRGLIVQKFKTELLVSF